MAKKYDKGKYATTGKRGETTSVAGNHNLRNRPNAGQVLRGAVNRDTGANLLTQKTPTARNKKSDRAPKIENKVMPNVAGTKATKVDNSKTGTGGRMFAGSTVQRGGPAAAQPIVANKRPTITTPDRSPKPPVAPKPPSAVSGATGGPLGGGTGVGAPQGTTLPNAPPPSTFSGTVPGAARNMPGAPTNVPLPPSATASPGSGFISGGSGGNMVTPVAPAPRGNIGTGPAAPGATGAGGMGGGPSAVPPPAGGTTTSGVAGSSVGSAGPPTPKGI